MSQLSFASSEYAMKKKRTRREKVLAEMERIVPWVRMIAVVESAYPTNEATPQTDETFYNESDIATETICESWIPLRATATLPAFTRGS